MRLNNSARLSPASSSLAENIGSLEGSSTNEAKSTARQAESGRLAHQRWSVEGCPCRMVFSFAEAALIASKGRATSISFLRVFISGTLSIDHWQGHLSRFAQRACCRA